MNKTKRPGFRFYIVLLMFCLETILVICILLLASLFPFAVNYFWIPFLVYIIVNSLNALFIINTNVNTAFRLSWITITIIFPFAGLIIYWLYADKITTKKMKKIRFSTINSELGKGLVIKNDVLNNIQIENQDAYAISNYILKNSFSAPYQNSSLEYFSMGDYVVESMLEELKKAKKFIFMEYFIIEYGSFFDSIYEILKEKAKEGLDVRLIYDDFGSIFKINANFYKKAIKDGIKCYSFNRCRPFMDIRQNNRDHRKMIIIDGVCAFTGGMNIADEYINKVERFGLRKDNCLMIKGEAVNGFTNLFLSNRKLLERDKEINHLLYTYESNKCLREENIISDGFIQPFGDVPFDNEETARNVLLQLISRAKKSIYISTPYLVPDDDLISALINASKSGIEVKIITPGIPDKKVCYSLTRSYYGKLAFYGIKIYEYTPGFNHTKLYVIDDKFAVTGTVNFDFRSLYLHFENAVFLYANSKVANMKEDLLNMVEISKKIDDDKYINVGIFKKLYWSILKIFAPLF